MRCICNLLQFTFIYQRKCFDTPLQPHMLDEVKELVRRSIPDGVADMGAYSGFTVKGESFLYDLYFNVFSL